MKQNGLRVIISGGHLTAAIPLIDRVIESEGEVLYLGREFASTDNNTRSREKDIVTQRGVKFVSITSPKLVSHRLIASMLKAPQVLNAVKQINTIIDSFQPTAVVSFGGYLGLPLVLAARLKGTPILIHEQTGTFGWANYLSRPFADRVALGNQNLFNGLKLWRGKSELTGNPLRSEFLNNIRVRPEDVPENREKPILMVTGGSQGSYAINQVVLSILDRLLRNYYVVHITGDAKAMGSWDKANECKSKLSPEYYNHYVPFKWLDAAEFNWVLSESRMVVSRAGANTVNEIMWTGVPTILIPLPMAHGNEQEINAMQIVENGAGLLLVQNKLSSHSLLSCINDVEVQYDEMKLAANGLKQLVISDADKRLLELVKAYETKNN